MVVLLKITNQLLEGVSFLGRRLISWKCKKQKIMATSTTEAEYVAAASGCGQVLWIQMQLLDYGAPWVPTVNRNNPPVNRKFSTGRRNFPTVNRKFPTASRKFTTGGTKFHTADMGRKGKAGSSQNHIDDKGYWDSGCSRHMTGNISYLSDFEPFDGGYVSFGQGGCKITECIVLGRNFKLLDDANILLRTPRQHNMYSIDLNNIVPHKDLTCLVAKASADECILWHRRLGHLNVKTINKLVRHNLVRGLPTKSFDNDHICTACLKGKQHKASCKSKEISMLTKEAN
nr:ribonuclease H-like domain-containing protein [Tanacetum cinerariifolium]